MRDAGWRETGGRSNAWVARATPDREPRSLPGAEGFAHDGLPVQAAGERPSDARARLRL